MVRFGEGLVSWEIIALRGQGGADPVECGPSVHWDRARGRNHGVAMLLGSSSIGTRWRRSCGIRELLKLVLQLFFVVFRCWKLPGDCPGIFIAWS